MIEPLPSQESRRARPAVQAAFAAAAAFAIALLYASTVPGLADSDPWAHLRYTTELWRSGFALRGHPYLPFTILGDSGVDPWLGFHWLLLPFTPLGVLWGARIAGACIAATVAAVLAFLLCRLGRRVSWPFAVAPLLLSSAFALRGHVARPSHLTIPLLLIELAAGFSALSPWWALGAAFVHGLLHLSSPLSPIFAAVGAFAAMLTRRQGGRPSLRAVAWAGAGLALALIIRPDRALYVPVALRYNLLALGFGTGGLLPHAGLEILRIPAATLLRQSGLLLVLLALALVVGRGRAKSGDLPARAAAVLATGLMLLLTLRAQRFIDYSAPLVALTAGLFWPRAFLEEDLAAQRENLLAGEKDLPARKKDLLVQFWRRAHVPTICLVLVPALAVALLTHRANEIGDEIPPFFDPPSTYAAIETAVRAHVPPGETIFTDDPFITEILYGVLPGYRYIAAYDPVFLYMGSPEVFWRWHHALAESEFCEERLCGGPIRGGAAVAKALDSFGAKWAITSYPRGSSSMQETMALDPARFDLVLIAPGTSNGLYLWRVRK